jgi:hypothetical protein
MPEKRPSDTDIPLGGLFMEYLKLGEFPGLINIANPENLPTDSAGGPTLIWLAAHQLRRD